MCLAVPGKVVEIWEDDASPTATVSMARVDFGGIYKEVSLDFVPDTQVGEYVIVHVGFALQKLDEQSALDTLKLFESLGELDAEFGDAWVRAAREAGTDSTPHENAPHRTLHVPAGTPKETA